MHYGKRQGGAHEDASDAARGRGGQHKAKRHGERVVSKGWKETWRATKMGIDKAEQNTPRRSGQGAEDAHEDESDRAGRTTNSKKVLQARTGCVGWAWNEARHRNENRNGHSA